MVNAKTIASFLGSTTDSQLEVIGVCSAANPKPHHLTFALSMPHVATLRKHPNTLVITARELSAELHHAIVVSSPRRSFALAVHEYFVDEAPPGIDGSAAIASGVHVPDDASIGHGVVIHENVSLGSRVRIQAYAVIHSGVRIGSDVQIGSHTVIGTHGFGFARDDAGVPFRMPHVGGVAIGDGVEIGNHVSIARGTIEDTVVSDHVKIDDCVFIAHNVRVGARSFIIAGAEISGSVTIGEDAWISPEVSVRNKVTIGDRALVGLGSVVVRDVASDTIVAGVPARVRE